MRQKLIRHMVAQKQGLNFENILNTKKIFLAKLSQGLIGEENAYLLGTLLVSKIHQAATARQAKEIGQREPFFLYLDEFQNFITPSMTAILSGARKYGLGLILAHQELRQLWNRDTELANSVISNPYTRICFRLGDFDSQKLKDGFSYFEAQDLQNLGIGEAICRIERAEYDFNLQALPLPEINEETARSKQQKLISLSRQKYASSREKIEEELAKERKWTPEVLFPPVEETKKPEPKKPVKKAPVSPLTEKIDIPVMEGKGGADHRYLQALIKRMAEEKGFRAIIEKPILDGSGSVDVSLESEKKKIACEVSLTTTGEQELGNITKCIEAGYDHVIMCSPERRNLEKIKELAFQKLSESDQGKVLFFQPEELFFYLEKESAKSAGKEERVKGYKVKVQYQPVKETEKKTKRKAVAQVIVSALKRIKDGDKS
ncbi:MAG TPA: type IV secretory system conjugative DNA transfer family protein [Thermodesulfobacteriota bacterium]|nr:type IV secretory system conjugative DNA transfer family protein [Thermodesulfobacteriota bacterium]